MERWRVGDKNDNDPLVPPVRANDVKSCLVARKGFITRPT